MSQILRDGSIEAAPFHGLGRDDEPEGGDLLREDQSRVRGGRGGLHLRLRPVVRGYVVKQTPGGRQVVAALCLCGHRGSLCCRCYEPWRSRRDAGRRHVTCVDGPGRRRARRQAVRGGAVIAAASRRVGEDGWTPGFLVTICDIAERL